jgi:hypothetical protein
MITIPTTEPSSVTAGDTLKWTRSLPDYPASAGWVLNYSLISNNGSIQIASVAAGDAHAVTVDFATSAQYVPGVYAWQAYVTNGTERYQVARGEIEVLADFAASSPGSLETRSHVKRVLDAIEAVIEGRAAKGDQELTIDGTRLVKMTVDELLKLRSTYFNLYRQEINFNKRAAGAGSSRVRQVIPR